MDYQGREDGANSLAAAMYGIMLLDRYPPVQLREAKDRLKTVESVPDG